MLERGCTRPHGMFAFVQLAERRQQLVMMCHPSCHVVQATVAMLASGGDAESPEVSADEDPYHLQQSALANLMLQPFMEHSEVAVLGGLRAAHVSKLLVMLKRVSGGARSEEVKSPTVERGLASMPDVEKMVSTSSSSRSYCTRVVSPASTYAAASARSWGSLRARPASSRAVRNLASEQKPERKGS